MLRQCGYLVISSQNLCSKKSFMVVPTYFKWNCYSNQKTKQTQPELEIDEKLQEENNKQQPQQQKNLLLDQLRRQKEILELNRQRETENNNSAKEHQQRESNQQHEQKEEEKVEQEQYSENKNQQQQSQEQQQQRQTKASNVSLIRNPFATASEKNKNTYLAMVEIFEERSVLRRNHVEFIYAALKNMAEFGVEHDLEVYKALINVMPKGKFIPTNIFQSEFMHYPKQQQCMIDLLEQMEDYGVIPDYEMEAMLLNIFGRKGHPLRKYWRMMYWMPKFKNLSPWALPNPIPDETLEIAKLAVERMCTVDLRSIVKVYETRKVKDAIDDTWIVSGMSGEQMELLNDHPDNKALYIEGPFLIWLRNRSIHYFTLRADADLQFLNSLKSQEEDSDDVSRLDTPLFGRPPTSRYQVGKVRSVHQQEDGTIFAICATGTSTKDSLLSWIRLLEADGNKKLSEIPVVFRFTSSVADKRIQIESSTTTVNKTTPVALNEKIVDDVR